MSTSPTQRTIRELKNQGRRCAIVEKWNAYAGPHGVRQDLFGIIDVIALDPERGVVGVQSCGQNFSAHVRKFLDERVEECIDWLSTPGTRLELWGWRKVKLKPGGKAMRWQPRIREFTLADFDHAGSVRNGDVDRNGDVAAKVIAPECKQETLLSPFALGETAFRGPDDPFPEGF